MNKTRGFTLIELMVAISIVAILAIIGLVIFGSIQQSSRDSKRKADVQAIGNALEVQRIKQNLDTYPQLTSSFFATDKIPTDPSTRSYCISSVTSGSPTAAIATPWTSADCTAGGAAIAGYSLVSSSTPVASAIAYRVCTSLEGGSVYCVTNQQ